MEKILKNIILASASPRRIEIMHHNGYFPAVVPSNADETLPYDMTMEEAVQFLALKKAFSVKEELLSGSAKDKFTGKIINMKNLSVPPLIIGADTVVYKTHIMGKPKDEAEAFAIFTELRNTFHFVATGVSFVDGGSSRQHTFCEVTKVFFKDYSDEDIRSYISTDEPWDKAGGYAIQGAWGKHVDHYEGDLNNVIGFPWDRITSELSSLPQKWSSEPTNFEENNS